jgi:hypothetical protein
MMQKSVTESRAVGAASLQCGFSRAQTKLPTPLEHSAEYSGQSMAGATSVIAYLVVTKEQCPERSKPLELTADLELAKALA